MEDYNRHAPTDLFAEESVIYGTFWQRFAAAIIDGLILIIPNYLILFTMGEGVGDILSIVMSWLYSALQESGPTQATIGKKVMGLKVTDVNGYRISFGQASGRYFGKIISTLVLLIGYFMMLWNEKSQTLHDKMAGTLVVAA